MDLKHRFQKDMPGHDAARDSATDLYDIAPLTDFFEVSQLASVDVLASGASTELVDIILVRKDYELIAEWSQTVGLRSTETLWKRGCAERSEVFKAQVIDSLNKVWYHSTIDKHNTKQSTLLYFYTGHGVSPLESETTSPVPQVDYDTATLARKESSMLLRGGDWRLHNAGFMGFDFMWFHFKNEISASPSTVINKTLLIVVDCCFSGGWCNYLREKMANEEFTDLKGCEMIIQSSTGAGQCAHGGIFIPVWRAIQDSSTREKWMAEFKQKSESAVDEYAAFKELQSPEYAATYSVDNNGMFAMVDNCGTGKSNISVALFTNPEFFWHCASAFFEKEEILCDEDLIKSAKILSASEALAALKSMQSLVVVDMKLKKYSGNYFALLRVNSPGCPSVPCAVCPTTPCTLCDNLCEVHIHYNEPCVSGQTPHVVPHVGFNIVNAAKNQVVRPLNAVKSTTGGWQNQCGTWQSQAAALLGKPNFGDPSHWSGTRSTSSIFGSFKGTWTGSLLTKIECSDVDRRALVVEYTNVCGVESGV